MSLPDMNPTRRSLLDRLKHWDDQESWNHFFEAYWKLIYKAAMQSGLNEAEAQDVVQETVLAVARKMPDFHYDPALGSFKSWLLLITRRRIVDVRRKQKRQVETVSLDAMSSPDASPLEAPAPDDLADWWDREWEDSLTDAALARVKARVTPKQFQIFDCYVLKQWTVSTVTKSLGVSASQVYLAKHRIAGLLKKELQHLAQHGFTT